jgi:hypothetical protein
VLVLVLSLPLVLPLGLEHAPVQPWAQRQASVQLAPMQGAQLQSAEFFFQPGLRQPMRGL